MPYKSRIKVLEETYNELGSQISNYEGDIQSLAKLKQKRQEHLDELNRLRKLQWEEEHDRVDFDDDR